MSQKILTNKAGTKTMVAPPKPDLSTAAVAQRTGLEKHLPPPGQAKPAGKTGPRAKANQAAATTPAGKKQYPPAGTAVGATKRGQGRQSILKTMSKEDIAKEVKEFLDELKRSTDPEEKKTIRRKLRARGHYGGLGGQGAVKKEVPAKPADKAK